MVGLREVLSYRIVEFGEVASDLYEAKKRVSAFTLTRQVLETVSMVFWLHQEVKRVVDNKQIGEIDDFLMKSSFGRRDEESLQAFNILKAVDKMDKKIPHFRDGYNLLSEYVHPNWSGCLGAYSKIDFEEELVYYGRNIRGMPLKIGLGLLVSSLELYDFYYLEIKDLMPEFTKICDKNGKNNPR